jgi:hypothetical protein
MFQGQGNIAPAESFFNAPGLSDSFFDSLLEFITNSKGYAEESPAHGDVREQDRCAVLSSQ